MPPPLRPLDLFEASVREGLGADCGYTVKVGLSGAGAVAPVGLGCD